MTITQRKRFIIIIFLTTIIGLAGGLVGAILARVYLLEKAFNIPFFGEMNFSANELNGSGSSLIISGAKKVVVEQNTKVLDTAKAVEKSIVGIFKKIPRAVDDTSTTSRDRGDKEFDLDKLYNINDALAPGFIITSDGWILTNFEPIEVKGLLQSSEQEAATALENIMNNYVVITKDQRVYTIDDIVFDTNSDYSFWHIQADDLIVRRFAQDSEIHNGQLVLAINWDSWSWLTSIIGQRDSSDSAIISSDEYESELILSEAPNEAFYSAFLFNLGGDLLGLIDSKGLARPISNFVSCINCLLEDQEIKRPYLGVNYIDLSSIVSNRDSSRTTRGALLIDSEDAVAVIKDSPADKAGLVVGDIILSVNNVDLNSDFGLNQAISAFKAGDEINISYEREGKIDIKKIVLDELVY